jgi:hypothetical protein
MAACRRVFAAVSAAASCIIGTGSSISATEPSTISIPMTLPQSSISTTIDETLIACDIGAIEAGGK